MSNLVWSQAAATSDDPEEGVFLKVARELQSQALLHQGRQVEPEQDSQQQFTCVKSLYPDRVMGAAVEAGARIDQPSPVDKVCSDKA